jgi:ABC-type transport system involved in multi-copper enzyme maturation permease subunit
VIGTIQAELVKIRTARSGWVIVALAIGASLLLCLVAALVNDFTADPPAEVLLSISQFSILFVTVLGVMSIAGEFRHGSIAPSLLVTPSRSRLLLAKLAAITIVGAVVGVIAAGGALAFGALIGPGSDALAYSGSDVVRALFTAALATALYGAMGLGVGSALRNQTGAVILILVLLLFVDNVTAGLWSHFAPYSLGSTLSAATGAPSQAVANNPPPLGQWTSMLLVAAYSLSAFAAGFLIFNRVDITD